MGLPTTEALHTRVGRGWAGTRDCKLPPPLTANLNERDLIVRTSEEESFYVATIGSSHFSAELYHRNNCTLENKFPPGQQAKVRACAPRQTA